MRDQGYIAAVTEKYNHFIKIRQDLFGFIDIIAVSGAKRETVAVQATTTSNSASRIEKIFGLPQAIEWLKAGNRIEVHGWAKRTAYRKDGEKKKAKEWQLRIDEIKLPSGRNQGGSCEEENGSEARFGSGNTEAREGQADAVAGDTGAGCGREVGRSVSGRNRRCGSGEAPEERAEDGTHCRNEKAQTAGDHEPRRDVHPETSSRVRRHRHQKAEAEKPVRPAATQKDFGIL